MLPVRMLLIYDGEQKGQVIIIRLSPQHSALPQAATLRCYRAKHPPRNSPRSFTKCCTAAIAAMASRSASARPKPSSSRLSCATPSAFETGTPAQDYIQLYEGDAKLLTESLDRIQAASRILAALPPYTPYSPCLGCLRSRCNSSIPYFGFWPFSTTWGICFSLKANPQHSYGTAALWKGCGLSIGPSRVDPL